MVQESLNCVECPALYPVLIVYIAFINYYRAVTCLEVLLFSWLTTERNILCEIISFHFVSFRFVSFRFVSFRFVSFRFVSFRFVLITLYYRFILFLYYFYILTYSNSALEYLLF